MTSPMIVDQKVTSTSITPTLTSAAIISKPMKKFLLVRVNVAGQDNVAFLHSSVDSASLNKATKPILKPENVEGVVKTLYNTQGKGVFDVQVREAATESDLYYEMVLKNEHFSLLSVLVEEYHSKHCCPLLKAVLKTVDPELLWSEDPKAWLTPSLAERIWKIKNDPRFHFCVPNDIITLGRDAESDPGVYDFYQVIAL